MRVCEGDPDIEDDKNNGRELREKQERKRCVSVYVL